MKRNILKTTALFIVLSGLLNSCTLFEDDSPSETVIAVATKSEAAKKAVLSLSVAGEEGARTALPSVSSAQEFESLDFGATSGVTSITKSWTSDSEKPAYAKMTSESFEMDAGTWSFALTAKKGGMTYKGSVEKEITAGANSIEFTLSLSELSNEGKGSVEIKLSVPQSVIAVTATLCDTSENEVSDSSITQSTDLTNNTVSYTAQNVPSGTYLVVFNLYADTSKTLLLGKWREYAGITSDVTSKSEIAIAAEDLDKVYTITYVLNGGTLRGNWAGSYTRRNFQTPASADFESRPSEFLGWYTDENLTNEFNSASLTGNLTLYAKWSTITVDELISKINDGTIGEKAVLGGAITSENLTAIATAMKNKQRNLALDLSMTKGLTSIGTEFKNCTYLTGISIPKTVTSIGSRAFYMCSGLKSVTIPEGVTSIGYGAFWGCSGLESVMIPSSVTSIREYAFIGCSGLESVMIPSSVASIGAMAFSGCRGLTSVTITEGVTSIGNSAFEGCSGLESVTIPGSVTSIEKTAFNGCNRLTSVTIPSSVTSIGGAAFIGCIGLKNVYYEGTLEQWLAISFENSASSPCCNGSDLYIQGNKITGELVIPDSVTSIGAGAFSGCSGLESVTIPEGVTSIGDSAFQGCSGLTEMTIPFVGKSVSAGGDASLFGYIFGRSSYTGGTATRMNYSGGSWYATYYIPKSLKTVTVLGGQLRYGAFYGCSGLESVMISEGVTSIGTSAFYGCSGLESVTIPEGVTSIGGSAFKNCSGLKSVYYGGTLDQWLAISFVSNPCCNGSDLYIQGNKITGDLVIPEGVTSIGDSAFLGCTWLKSVTIPSSVKSIGTGAFWECSGLESVMIPSSVTNIGYGAFYNCSKLANVYYRGTEAQWNAINIVSSRNDNLTNATKTYNYTGE